MGERVLVIDDHPQNSKLVRVLLSLDGHSVQIARDAEEALALMETLLPRMILMDLQLPGMDGLALTRLLKNDPATKHIVIIAVTGYAMKGDRERAMTAGCDDYVAKPIDGDQLQALVASYLARG